MSSNHCQRILFDISDGGSSVCRQILHLKAEVANLGKIL